MKLLTNLIYRNKFHKQQTYPNLKSQNSNSFEASQIIFVHVFFSLSNT